MAKRFAGIAAAAAVAALAGAVVLGGCACSAVPAADGGGITVSASSETQVVPDMARITVAVQSRAATAEACQKDNAKDVNAVIEALKAAGVTEENIQTEWTNLNPIQDYDAIAETLDEPVAAGGSSAVAETSAVETSVAEEGSTPGIIGYEMYTSLSVEGISVDAVSSISSAVVAAGATDVSGIQYYASSYDEAYQAALQKAIDEAREKAEFIAGASGVRLGGVVEVTEGYQNTGYRYAENAMAFAEEDAAGGDALAKTMPGQVDITAEVTVRFAIS